MPLIKVTLRTKTFGYSTAYPGEPHDPVHGLSLADLVSLRFQARWRAVPRELEERLYLDKKPVQHGYVSMRSFIESLKLNGVEMVEELADTAEECR